MTNDEKLVELEKKLRPVVASIGKLDEDRERREQMRIDEDLQTRSKLAHIQNRLFEDYAAKHVKKKRETDASPRLEDGEKRSG